MQSDIKILAPDAQLQRADHVIQGVLKVRFLPGALETGTPQELLEPWSITAVEALLAPEKSLAYGKRKTRAARTLTGERLEYALRCEEPLLRTFIVRYESDTPPEEVARALRSSNRYLEIAEPYCVPVAASPTPADPNDPQIDVQLSLQTMRAFEAWEIYAGDPDVVIGIIDTGVNQDHEDLRDNIWINSAEIPDNEIDDDGNGYIDDYRGFSFTAEFDNTKPGDTFGDGHGTAVAGIAGATTDNGVGVAGVGNQCRIFPLKCGVTDKFVEFAYQGLLYCAEMGFDVANCSWGGFTYSEIDRSIVDYVTARGVAVVAGAGNHADIRPSYPEAYPNALSVGVTHTDDVVTDASAFGPSVDIMTPGERSRTTGNGGAYGWFDFTSAATPIASGAVALVRGRHPELSPQQALQFLRLSRDNIDDKNPELAGLIPGRLNLLKAMQNDPMATPAVRPIDIRMERADGIEPRAFQTGDVVRLIIRAKNYLGAAVNAAGGDNAIRFRLSSLLDPFETIFPVSGEVMIDPVTADSEFVIEGLSFSIEMQYEETVILRIDMESDNYSDFFLIPFIPTGPEVDYATFENNDMIFSVGDRGRLGFADVDGGHSLGRGFILKPFGNLLDAAGWFGVENGFSTVGAVESDQGEEPFDDFVALERFVEPDKTRGVMNDEAADGSRKIGLTVEQEYAFAPDNGSIVAVRVAITNTAALARRDVGFGAFFDWHIGPFGRDNRVRALPDFEVQGFDPGLTAIGVCERDGEFPIAVCGVLSDNSAAQPQFAGFDIDNKVEGTPFGTLDGFSVEEKHRALTSGTQLSYAGAGDAACVTGMYFPGEWPTGERRSFIMVFGAVADVADIGEQIQRALGSFPSAVAETDSRVDMRNSVVPQPAIDYISLTPSISTAGRYTVAVFTLDGKRALPDKIVDLTKANPTVTLSINELQAGMYIARLRSLTASVMTVPFVIVR